MKLVDILFVLSAAVTVNAVLVPFKKDGSLQSSGTSSQVSDPTNEPNPGTSNEYQQEPMDLSFSGRTRQRTVIVAGPNTYSQGQRQTVIVAGPNTSSQGQRQTVIVAGPSTSSQVQQSANEPSSGIPDQNQQHPTGQSGSSTSEEYWKRLSDIIDSSTSKRSRKRPINESSPSSSKRIRQQPIDQPGPSTSSQVHEQPMSQDESANTSSNQMTGLNERDQKVLDRIKERLAESKEIRRKKRQEYNDHTDLVLNQQLALARGEDISESKYDPKDEIRLKQECRKASIRVHGITQELKRFMTKHGLEFEEPSSDSD
ncbi:hypothetical protein O5D80_001612 [Batrachochytrium dendrobatidis]|nr:hypothetical protein O5D80_001612 [Batrachochytrium dendrobatidis]